MNSVIQIFSRVLLSMKFSFIYRIFFELLIPIPYLTINNLIFPFFHLFYLFVTKLITYTLSILFCYLVQLWACLFGLSFNLIPNLLLYLILNNLLFIHFSLSCLFSTSVMTDSHCIPLFFQNFGLPFWVHLFIFNSLQFSYSMTFNSVCLIC